MDKLAAFIVDKRKVILAIMLAFTLAGACCIPFVTINHDVAKYLPDSSSMKQGLDIVEEEFPDQASQFIRVMFDGIPAHEEEAMRDALAEIEGVERVEWEADSPEYHNNGKTVYLLYTKANYESPEELAIEHTLKAQFDVYDMVCKSGSTASDLIPVYVIIAAVILIFVVLLLTGGSFFEPLLILITVGCSVAINFGSNIIQGSISSITLSIAAILQLALSIDYSVILLNRYRAEKRADEAIYGSDKVENYDATMKARHIDAMKRALRSTFGAVASSGITTVVGLLALVFMSFKIGADIGIVLGKGIGITLLCVLTMLPGLVLGFDKVLMKTVKKAPHFAMKTVGAITAKGRFAFTLGFVALFIGAYFAQNITSLAYTLEDKGEINENFRLPNQVALVYENSDEENVAQLEGAFGGRDDVSSITGYSTTIGKPLTASEFLDAVDDLSSQSNVSSVEGFTEDVLRLMYYDYFDGTTFPMNVERFFNFVFDEVLPNENFSSEIDTADKTELESFRKFASADALTLQRNAAGLASFLNMSESEVQQVLLGYGIAKNCYDVAPLSVAEFITFVNKSVVNDPTYGASISAEQKAALAQAAAMLDVQACTTPLPAESAAAFLSIDQAQMQTIYLLYFAQQNAAAADTMTIVDFVTFLQADAMSNPLFASQMGSIDPAQLQLAVMQAQMNGVANVPFDAPTMAASLGMDQASVALLYTYHHQLYGDTSTWLISIQDLLHFMLENEQVSAGLSSDQLAQLTSASRIIDTNVAGTRLSPSEMGALLGMATSDTKTLYLLRDYQTGNTGSWTASVHQIVTYLCDDVLSSGASTSISENGAQQLRAARTLCDAVVAGTEYNTAEMSNLLNTVALQSGKNSIISDNQIKLLYLFEASQNHYQDNWAMSLDEFVNYLVSRLIPDERFASWMTEERQNRINDMKVQIDDAKAQLIGEKFSLLQLKLNSITGSSESDATLIALDEWLSNNLSGEYHLMGSAVMSLEMSESFHDEMLFITLLTAIAIFLVVALTFRNLLIPLILVLLVECGVWITVTVIGLQGYSIYYLALVVVQCILMGATIDYGILFTTNYREHRRTMPIKEALIASYSSSINTVLTSGTILVLVCAIVGTMFENPTIGQICNTISIGAFCTIILILIFLPGLLATFDAGTAGKNRLKEK